MTTETRNEIQELIKELLVNSDMVKSKVHSYPENKKGELNITVTLSFTTQNKVITKEFHG